METFAGKGRYFNVFFNLDFFVLNFQFEKGQDFYTCSCKYIFILGLRWDDFKLFAGRTMWQVMDKVSRTEKIRSWDFLSPKHH